MHGVVEVIAKKEGLKMGDLWEYSRHKAGRHLCVS